jgi:hypothetical protein
MKVPCSLGTAISNPTDEPGSPEREGSGDRSRGRYCCRPKLRLIVSCPLKSILDGSDPKEHSDLPLLKSQLDPSPLQDYELFIYLQLRWNMAQALCEGS